ncbi:hypothetical protein B0T18DRAFT_415107 [Schizothecium vesticola]|uniref:Peroxin 20 n=1 Tax=Schizothecium vesticola TaxID=314040 RepID=A0AA40K2H9_9PEZI|nr:hypothetical protein B0T18DRAFT_415107 [Schizothecium vesticola]
MADSLCGPSNGAKNLLSHADRDRSLQQDRLVGGANGSPATFRSQLNRSGADEAFAGFQQNGHMEPVLNGMPAGIPNHAFHFPGIAAPMAPINHPIAPQFATHQPTPAAHDWVNQFAGMNVGNKNAPAPALAQPHQGAQIHGRQTNMGYGFGQAGFAGPFGAQQFGMTPQMPMHAPTTMAYGTQNQSFATMQQNESALDVDAFNKAFGDYDDTEFDAEIAKWAEKEAPAGEQVTALPVQPVEEVAEQQPQEEDAAPRRREDEELARAAISILGSVEKNNSEKFKNSNFFELMRRIGNREVVVEGPNLVDSTTGETVVARSDDGDGAEEPAARTLGA